MNVFRKLYDIRQKKCLITVRKFKTLTLIPIISTTSLIFVSLSILSSHQLVEIPLSPPDKLMRTKMSEDKERTIQTWVESQKKKWDEVRCFSPPSNNSAAGRGGKKEIGNLAIKMPLTVDELDRTYVSSYGILNYINKNISCM